MKKFTKKLPLIIILTILCTVLFVSVFAGFLAPYDPLQIDMSSRLAPPTAEHLLGTDTLGRDVFSRILYGGRQSILLALAATICSMLFGLIIGIVEGYLGGPLDVVLTAISNVFQGLPGMIVMIALVGVLGPGTKSIILALIITSWVGFSRIVRGEVLRVKSETYIEGLRNLGAGRLRIIVKSVIPNISANLIVLFATRVGRVILAVSGLSYLGIGIQPPTPDWGAMISDARRYFRTAPHLLWAPGLCIILLALAINMLGDYLRDKSDVKRGAEAGGDRHA